MCNWICFAVVVYKVNYGSVRSEKARISIRLRKMSGVLLALFFGFILISFVFFYLKQSSAWVFVGVSVVPLMIREWQKGELAKLAVKPKKDDHLTVDDILSSEILGLLSDKPTPLELATITSQLPGGHFFNIRFGISGVFLSNIASKDSADTKNVWKKAFEVMKQVDSDCISTTILIVAILKCAPNYQNLLNHLQLDESDLIEGVKWHARLRMLADSYKELRKTGGIARDWSFGWTPLLNRFAQNISQNISQSGGVTMPLVAHEDIILQLMNIFSKKGRQNVLMVGPSGVGKAEIIHNFASKLINGLSGAPKSLRYVQIYSLDASIIISSVRNKGDLERLVNEIMIEAYRSKNSIICLEKAQLFFEDGVGSIDISNILLPVLEAGKLKIILTMDEQRYLQISQRMPELANALNCIMVNEPDKQESMLAMRDNLINIEFQHHVSFMYQSLEEAYRLSERYMHDMSMPGKAIKLLEMSANYNDGGLVTAESVRRAIEKTLGVVIGVASADERDKLLNLEDLIHERIIGQSRAVQAVCNSLRRARAGVRNQNRPIGTFLFLGPTGVGKSELAKALASAYFKGEDQMIRLDMNEYVSHNDVVRLIADGADNPKSLTAQVMKKPFSVVLLDEIEKAHPDVLMTFLQMLDEGILRDVKNREISFRDAIIIATSNVGSDRICEYINRGYDLAQFESTLMDEVIKKGHFKPEFINRFDDVVVFEPLKKDELLKIVDLILDSVNDTLQRQKISINVSDEAKNYLMEAGYSPEFGARSIRRVVQRTVENTVAKQMLGGDISPGSVIEIDINQVRQIIDISKQAEKIVANSSSSGLK